MALSINLRSDLAKLTDAELGKRLQENWDVYELANIPKPRWYSIGLPLMYGLRGPIRHRRAYRLLLAIGYGSGIGWLDLLFVLFLANNKAEELMRKDSTAAAHLSACEIRDIMDELERRFAQRRGRST